jgi:hypothetical protein
VELVAGAHNTPEKLDAALHGVSRLHITVTAGLAEVEPELVQRADAEYAVGWYAAPGDSSTTVDDTVARATGRPARSPGPAVDAGWMLRTT